MLQPPVDQPSTDSRRRSAEPPEERALIARVAGGDRVAFEQLYRAYFPRLGRFLDRMLRRPHLVEEVLNDTMLVVWHKAATFNGQSKLSTWIFAIAYRKALKASGRFDEPVESDDDALEMPGPGPEGELTRHELRGVLGEAIGRMSAEHQAVIELTYYHGCPYREIAQIVGCPVDTVKTRMFHARRRLRDLLAGHKEDLL